MNTMEDINKYPHPFVTVDVLIFTIEDKTLKLVLVKRNLEPFKGGWAIPGGFVRKNESVEEAAKRELFEETNIKNIFLEQLYTFGDLHRDPRGRVISVAYYALIQKNKLKLMAKTDASEAALFDTLNLPPLAFDHASIVACALDRLRAKIGYSSVAVNLLPEQFRLTELQDIYETILGVPQDKRNFRKKMLSLGLLEKIEGKLAYGSHRPASLYRFKDKTPIIFN